MNWSRLRAPGGSSILREKAASIGSWPRSRGRRRNLLRREKRPVCGSAPTLLAVFFSTTIPARTADAGARCRSAAIDTKWRHLPGGMALANAATRSSLHIVEPEGYKGRRVGIRQVLLAQHLKCVCGDLARVRNDAMDYLQTKNVRVVFLHSGKSRFDWRS